MGYNVPDLPASEIERLIREWVRGKTEKELLRDRILDELTIEELAEKYALSVSGVKSKLKKAEDQLYSHLGQN